MSIARIVWLVSALAAVVLAFVSGDQFAHGGAVLAVLGLASGWFLDNEHRRGVIIAAIFLGMSGGAGALGSIPGVGEHLDKILGSLGAVFAAAAVMAIVRTMVERIMKANNT